MDRKPPCNPGDKTMAGDRPQEDPPMQSATFHLDDGRYLVVTVVRASAAPGFECGVHKTRLELISADWVLLRRANLAPMLREEPR